MHGAIYTWNHAAGSHRHDMTQLRTGVSLHIPKLPILILANSRCQVCLSYELPAAVALLHSSGKNGNYVWLISRPFAAVREDELIHRLPGENLPPNNVSAA